MGGSGNLRFYHYVGQVMRLGNGLPGAEAHARTAIVQAGQWLKSHPEAPAYPINDFRHLMGEINQANRTRPPQLLRECLDVLLLLFMEVPIPPPGSRLSRAMEVTRETFGEVERWLEYAGVQQNKTSPRVQRRIEEAGL